MKFIGYSKRVIALLLISSMLVAAAACGGDDTETTATDAPTATESESATDTVAPTESGSESGSENDTQGNTESDTVTESNTQAPTDTESNTQAPTDTESNTEAGADTNTESNTESNSDTQGSTESSSENNTEAPTETETKKDDGLLATDILLSGETPFRIVYADGYKSLANRIANKIVDLDKNYKAGKYSIKKDTDVEADGTPEILVGPTNRKASETAKKMTEKEPNSYAVYVLDDVIAIYADSENGLESAVNDVLTRFSKKGESVIYSNTKGNYTKLFDSNTIASDLLDALARAATSQPVLSISVATTDGISTKTVKGGNPCQNCYSVTKVYCVTAIGILFDQGKIKTTDTIGDIFADEIKRYGINESKWANITIHDVMRHRAGFTQGGFLDIDSQDATKWGSQDYLKLVLEANLSGNKDYKYTDGAFYLISRVVSKISGKNLDEFLAEHLFNKTECREYAFASCPQGYPIGATGLYIRSEDVAKLGRIYLDGGKYKGKQIISQKWVDLVIENGYELGKSGTGYAKGGMRGQNLYINYDKNLAVAWHAYDDHNLGTTLSNYMAK